MVIYKIALCSYDYDVHQLIMAQETLATVPRALMFCHLCTYRRNLQLLIIIIILYKRIEVNLNLGMKHKYNVECYDRVNCLLVSINAFLVHR